MKQIVALILVIIMMVTLTLPVLAETDVQTGTTQIQEDQTGAVIDVTYGIATTYTVTLPSSITFGKTKEVSADVSASEVVIPVGKKLVVAVFSATSIDVDNKSETPDVAKEAWTMISPEGGVAKYSVNLVGNKSIVGSAAIPIANGSSVLTVPYNQEGAAKTQRMYFDTEGADQAGSYIDKLTFKVSVSPI